jgi:hypothetical protein
VSYDSMMTCIWAKHFARSHFLIFSAISNIIFWNLFFASLSVQFCLTFFEGMNSMLLELINSKPFIIHPYTTLQSLAKP